MVKTSKSSVWPRKNKLSWYKPDLRFLSKTEWNFSLTTFSVTPDLSAFKKTKQKNKPKNCDHTFFIVMI